MGEGAARRCGLDVQTGCEGAVAGASENDSADVRVVRELAEDGGEVEPHTGGLLVLVRYLWVHFGDATCFCNLAVELKVTRCTLIRAQETTLRHFGDTVSFAKVAAYMHVMIGPMNRSHGPGNGDEVRERGVMYSRLLECIQLLRSIDLNVRYIFDRERHVEEFPLVSFCHVVVAFCLCTS